MLSTLIRGVYIWKEGKSLQDRSNFLETRLRLTHTRIQPTQRWSKTNVSRRWGGTLKSFGLISNTWKQWLTHILWGGVYIMDHDVVPRPMHVKYVNGCWTHPGATSVYIKEKTNVRVIMKFEVPKRHILRPTSSIDMVQRVLWWGRQKRCSCRKRQGPMPEKCCYNKFFDGIFMGEEKMKTREDKKMTSSEFFFNQNYPFWACNWKSTHSLFGAQSFLLVRIQFTPSEGPKGFVDWSWDQTYVREEPTVSYKWTGWVWGITSWSWRLHEKYQWL